MSYRRVLLLRWSRRDRLAIVVIAVTVAFLTGTVVMINAAETQTTEIATEFESPGTVAFRSGEVGGADGGVGLPVAAVHHNGTATYVIGRPSNVSPIRDRGRRLWTGRSGVTRGDIDQPQRHRVRGQRATLTLNVSPRPGDRAMVPPSWYVAEPGTTRELGRTATLVVTVDNGTPVPEDGVPLLGALSFFVAGTRELLRALTAATIGGGLLVGVTVYSVTRMSVRDRRTDIRVIRSTGGTGRTVIALFAARAGLLTATGVALGYAVGVILVNAAVNAAVYVGLPTSLAATVTSQVARQLVPVIGALIGVGGLAGALAALAVARGPPGRIRADEAMARTDDAGRFAPTLLGWRTLVPTAATLIAFMLFASLVAGAAGAALPVTQADTAVVTEPGAPHPIASQVPASYAEGLRDDGIEASPEILLLTVHDGQPYLARGANYTAFAALSDASLVAGTEPRNATDAVIGAGLARTLDADVGDALLIGGSTSPAVSRIRIVGRFTAPGPFDDQLIVPLATARHLAGVPGDRVQFIRADRLPEGANASQSGVVDVQVPDPVRANTTIPVQVTLQNDGLTERERTVRVGLGTAVRERTVRLGPNSQRTVTVRVPTPGPGRYTLRVDEQRIPVRVLAPNAIRIEEFPTAAPPGGRPQLRVVNVTGAGVANATVTVGGRTYRTDANGRVRIRLPSAGSYTVRAESGGASARTQVVVSPNASRRLLFELGIRPRRPSQLIRPVAHLTVTNPWNRSLERTLEFAVGDRVLRRRVTVAPGGRERITVELPRQQPGRYTLRVDTAGRTVANGSYAVTGDDRLAAALATAGRAGTSGIGAAIETAFGNLQLLLGVLTGLAGLMSVGGTTAVFAQAVQARRRTIGIHRSVGATPAAILRLVLADAARIGIVASVLAFGVTALLLIALGEMGYLTVFGVRLNALPSVGTAVGLGIAGVALTLIGAGTATATLLRLAPGALLQGPRRRAPPTGPDSGGDTR